ncbi:MAG: thiol protease/hemagglutinin PrtT [Candidatus Delongbacteria bacterium]|jgi:hypothetical protein|nr:thiol protease/hemagglutinin PrtT [Candidatus Delongbacteria bacterium]
MSKIVLMIIMMGAMLSAAIVDQSRAQKVAENYYQNYAPISAKSNTVQKILTKEYMGQPTWYVVKFTEGFVIVAADDNVRPILGYSIDGKIDEDIYNMNNPFVARFSAYDRQIVHVVREQELVVKAKQKEWKDIENKIFPQSSKKSLLGPLLDTTWGQGYPFNDQCPAGTYVGCVATAMHQIMRFHQGPDSGVGSNSYNDISGDTTGTHSVDFTTGYDWSLMQTLNGNTSSQQEVDELAKMSYHLGVSIDMDYNTDGSNAYMTDALTAYINNWDATDALYMNMGTVTDSSVYSSTIMTELDANRPMQFAGSSAGSGGHSYVVDGYNVDSAAGIYLYHFNWGWSGSYDGWYQLNDLTPGTLDFTESQEFIYNIEVGSWDPYIYAPVTNLKDSIINYENVSLTWDWEYDSLTLKHFEVLRNDELISTLPDSLREYQDSSLTAGFYKYDIVAYYNTYAASRSISVDIVADPSYPIPIALSATSYQYNRQKIDLAWVKPFIGTEYMKDDFESNAPFDLPAGWWQKGASTKIPSSWVDIDTGVGADLGFIAISKDNYPQWVFQGDYSCGTNGNGDTNAYSFLITDDSFMLPGGSGVVDYWTFYYDGTEQGVFLYSGTVGGSPDGNIILLKEYTTGDETWTHDEIDLSSYSGTFRFGFYKKTIDGGSLSCFDNVILGEDSYPAGDQPVTYDIYRNGSFLTNVAVTGASETYEDNSFADGENEYYVKALYAGGNNSIGSDHVSAWIDANPVPQFLEGTYDTVDNKVDLTWYAPGHYPIHWFGYEWETDSWDYLPYDYSSTGEIQKARTIYTAQDFDMGYNIYLEKVSAAFFEDVGVEDWSSDQFRFVIGTGTFGSEVVLHTSGWLTAVEDGTWVDYTISGGLTVSEDWYVEVELGSPTDGTPTVLTNVHEEGVDDDKWNSRYYWTGDGSTFDPGWYAVPHNPSDEYVDFAFQCYGNNDEPTITKGSAPKAREVVEFTPLKSRKTIDNVAMFGKPTPKNEQRAPYLTNYSSKALESYNVYRDEMLLGNTTNKFYTDINPLEIANYYVTTVYSDPDGESAPSNVIVAGSTSIEESNLPFETKLEQNYPNPFNPTTNINFSVMSDNNVKLEVFNISGQLVTTLVNKFMKQGSYNITLDASSLTGGVYLYKLVVDGKTMTKKMLLIK